MGKGRESACGGRHSLAILFTNSFIDFSIKLIKKQRKIFFTPVLHVKALFDLDNCIIIYGGIERDLISSHQKEKLYEESLAVAKIKPDPNDFFQICTKK